MTTLIATGGALGDRRCDAKCYDAESPGCDCVCGGANHGAGLTVASEQTAAMGQALLDRYGADVEVLPQQQELPT